MRLDIDYDIKVAAFALRAGRISLAAQLEMLSVLHARWDLDIDLAGFAHPSRAAAFTARAGDGLSSSAALAACCGGDHLAEGSILGPGNLTRAPAIAAGDGVGAGLCTASVAGRAAFRSRNIDVRLQTT